jgi:hypothetical protein
MNHVWGEFLAAVKFAGADPPGEFRRKTPFEAVASAAAAIFEPIRIAAQGMDVACILSRHALSPVLGL